MNKGDIRFLFAGLEDDGAPIIPIDLVLSNNVADYNTIAPVHQSFLQETANKKADHDAIVKLYNIEQVEYNQWMSDSLSQFIGFLISKFKFPYEAAVDCANLISDKVAYQLMFRHTHMGLATLPPVARVALPYVEMPTMHAVLPTGELTGTIHIESTSV